MKFGNLLKYVKWLVILIAIFIVMSIIGFINDDIFEQIPFGEYLWLVIIAAGCVAWYKHKEKVQRENELARKRARQEALNRKIAIERYRRSLAPANWTHWQIIKLSNYDAQLLGQSQNSIRYMFIDANKVITFPESKYGNRLGYYLINIDFHKKQKGLSHSVGNGVESGNTSEDLNGNQSITGVQGGGGDIEPNTFDSGYHGGYAGGFHGSGPINMHGNGTYNGTTHLNTNGTINYKELPTHAILTLTTTDLSNSFKIRLLDVTSSTVDVVKQYYELNQVEKQKLGLLR